MDSFKFSIIIPHKNIPNLLLRCVNSIPQRGDIQVVIVDDCSNSNIFDLLTDTGHSNIQIFRLPESQNAGYARNIGLKHAKGKWILFADADDFFSDSIVQILDKYSDSDADIVFFNYERVDSGDIERKITNYRQSFINNITNNDILEQQLRYVAGPPWCKLISHKLIAEYKIEFDEVPKHNDTMFSLKIGFYAKKIIVDSTVGYFNTHREGSITTSICSNIEEYTANIFQVELDYYCFCKGKGIDFTRWRLWDTFFSSTKSDFKIGYWALKFFYSNGLLFYFIKKTPIYLVNYIGKKIIKIKNYYLELNTNI